MNQGYYRFPTIFGKQICFVSEDDLWTVSALGGPAQRLTASRGVFTRPRFSPDGKTIAFSASEEGAMEVFVMPSTGGKIERLTFLGSVSTVVGWTPDGDILFSSLANHPQKTQVLFSVNPKNPSLVSLNLGPATSLAVHQKGWIVLERNSHRPDPAHWKRYRGGTAGQLWTATSATGEFKRILTDVKGNLAAPLWLNNRIYFLSDHSGWGNLYSCKIDGTDLKTHTKHREFYARNISSDGRSIVYHAGADLYLFDPKSGRSKKVNVEYHSQRPQRQRKLVSATENFESCHLSPSGQQLVYTTRGQVFNFNNWQGPAYRNGHEDAVRFRLGRWLSEKRLMAVSDSQGRDQIEIFDHNLIEPVQVIAKDMGRVIEVKVAPNGKMAALSNHRNELFVLDIEKKKLDLVCRDHFDFIHTKGFSWSPDSKYLAFCEGLDRLQNQIKIFEISTGKVRAATHPGLAYSQPTFDSQGKFLFFLCQEKLNPVYSDLIFDMSFPRTAVPGVITLGQDTVSPFVFSAVDLKETKAKKESVDSKSVSVKIDWTGIEQRSQTFPVAEAKIRKFLVGQDRLFLVSDPVKGSARHVWLSKEQPAESRVQTFNFKTGKLEDFLNSVSDFYLNESGSHFLAKYGHSFRVGKVSEKTWKKDDKGEFSDETGWVNLSRIQVMINPVLEWEQMFGEVWRLQRDFFWTENMSGVDWVRAFKQYRPLINRIGSRSEFSDLVWEMQGELATSHAYDIGGDHKVSPQMSVGKLGADVEFDAKSKSYKVRRILDGKVREFKDMSPLRQPGLNIKAGEKIVAIDGIEVTPSLSPEALLVSRAQREVEVAIEHAGGKVRNHTVFTLADDKNLRYRQWVEDNREYVHRKTAGKIGYVHVPDMSADGYAEFFRSYLSEFDKDGLIIDVRFNGGGHVSQLILEYLLRRRLGVDQTRWIGLDPYPSYSPRGPMVALTNQYAGSDGDIFSHSFKLLKLGPLIGTRTWGGVIGIYPRNFLADGGITTQPEFSYWFNDVGWGIENYGAVPDIEVDIAPHHYRRGEDPQLDRGIEEVQKIMKERPPHRPTLTNHPNLSV